MKKLCLKSCKECHDTIMKKIHGIKGVTKVEALGTGIVVWGEFDVAEALSAAQCKKHDVFQSVENVAKPPEKPPAKPAEKPPAKPAEKPPVKPAEWSFPPYSNNMVIIVNGLDGCRSWFSHS